MNTELAAYLHPPSAWTCSQAVVLRTVLTPSSSIQLPEYILDMGTVLEGYTEKRTVEISSPGPMEVSFQVDQSVLQDTGRQCWRHFLWA